MDLSVFQVLQDEIFKKNPYLLKFEIEKIKNSPDNLMLAVSIDGESRECAVLFIFDCETFEILGKFIKPFLNRNNNFLSIFWSPDSSMIGAVNNTHLYLWNVYTKENILNIDIMFYSSIDSFKFTNYCCQCEVILFDRDQIITQQYILYSKRYLTNILLLQLIGTKSKKITPRIPYELWDLIQYEFF